MNIQIKKATYEDAEFISLLGRITFTETFGNLFRFRHELLEYYDKTFSVSKIRAGLRNENNVFWLAFVDDLPAGYAKLKKYSPSQFILSDSVSQLQKIYVLKDFISNKIGFGLQNALFEEVEKIGSENLWLSVLHSNERAIQFYKKNDFRQTGHHSFQIGSENFDFIAMNKKF
jgi:hypothetical protein